MNLNGFVPLLQGTLETVPLEGLPPVKDPDAIVALTPTATLVFFEGPTAPVIVFKEPEAKVREFFFQSSSSSLRSSSSSST